MGCCCRRMATPNEAAGRAALSPMPRRSAPNSASGCAAAPATNSASIEFPATGKMNTARLSGAERRLAAILAADVAGYSRLIGADEEGTLDRLRSIRAELIDPQIERH